MYDSAMSNNNNRNRKGGGQSSGRRRRGRTGGGNAGGGQNVPRGPVMTSLGESTYEAVFDHGNEGYGVWFDGMVKDDPVYRQFWKGNRPIFVRLEEDQIVISKSLPGSDGADDAEDDVIEAANAVSVEIDFDDDEPAFVMDPDPADDLGDDAEAIAEGDRVYTPEEAAQLFAAEAVDAADAAEAAAAAAEAQEAAAAAADEQKPKAPPARRKVATRKKKTEPADE